MEKYQVLSEIKEILIKNNLSLSSAESCTGGLISSYLTDIDGASKFIYQNFVTKWSKFKVIEAGRESHFEYETLTTLPLKIVLDGRINLLFT